MVMRCPLLRDSRCCRSFAVKTLVVTQQPSCMQGKPSDRSPKKKRFFQLSHDGSTLRWSWNKYIVMYYVEVSR